MDVDGEIRLSVWVIDNAPTHLTNRAQLRKWCENEIWSWDDIPRSRRNQIVNDWENFNVIDQIEIPTRTPSFVERFKATVRKLFRRRGK